MQIFQIKDLEARGVLTPNASTLVVKGCPFYRGPAFAKSRWQVAEQYSHQLDQGGTQNFVIEEELCVTVWRTKPGASTPAISSPASIKEPSMPALSAPGLDRPFVDQCEQELAMYVGPRAKQLVQATLPQLVSDDAAALVCALAQKLPDPMLAQTFRDKLMQVLSGQPQTFAEGSP